MRLFRNPKSAVYLIVAFVVAFLLLLAIRARAESTIQVEGGSAVLRGYTPTLGLSIQWPEAGPARTDYELGFMLIGDGNYLEKPQIARTLPQPSSKFFQSFRRFFCSGAVSGEYIVHRRG